MCELLCHSPGLTPHIVDPQIFQRLSISPNDGCGKAKSSGSSGGTSSHPPGGPTKLGSRFGRHHQSVNYTQHRDQNRTPTTTRSRRLGVAVASSSRSPEINQQRFNRGIRSEDNSTTYDEVSYEEEHHRRVNLYGSAEESSCDDFDRLPGYYEQTTTPTTSRGGNKSGHHRKPTGTGMNSNEIDDPDHPVIFVENRVYVAPHRNGGKDQFECYDLGEGRIQNSSSSYAAHLSTPKRAKKVLFEKVNYEKYRRVTSGRSCTEFDDDDDEEGEAKSGELECHQHRRDHYFSNGQIDRNEYGQKWCQDLLNWSRDAAEFQRKQHHESGYGQSVDSNWFQDRFRGAVGSRYNKMSSTDDSGVVCHFEDSAAAEEDDEDAFIDDEDFWTRSDCASDMNSQRQREQRQSHAQTESPPDESWEALKQRVFEPAETDMPRMVRDSEGRLLGRRCSCNSMCTSLCTLETWLDDETFDNSFNEELERRCGISSN